MEVFGSSGVRGVALAELKPADVLDIAQAAGNTFAADTDCVAVGRDSRETGALLVSAVASGLASVGCSVDRVGVVPTPALQAYCERREIPGVMVTASHNPPEYNGIKLCGADGVELDRETIEAVEAKLGTQHSLVSWDGAGDIEHVDGVRRQYREGVLASVDRERIAAADLTVALDPGHGAGALTSPEIFTDLGCEVTTINAQPDGTFPGRDPEPVEDNLADLGRLVRSAGADVGIAHDGDGDRAIFFDETGSFVEGDAALAVIAARQLDAGDTVVSAVNCSQRLIDVADDTGADVHLTPIGSTNLISAIHDLQANGETVPIAGEGNGGIIFPEYRIARDGAFTAAKFCELLADHTVSDLIGEYDGYVNVRHNVAYEDAEERTAMVAAIEELAHSEEAELDTTDGYRLDYGDGWVLARPSGTEPVVRVYAEAGSESRAEDLAGPMIDAIESVGS